MSALADTPSSFRLVSNNFWGKLMVMQSHLNGIPGKQCEGVPPHPSPFPPKTKSRDLAHFYKIQSYMAKDCNTGTK